MPSAIVIKKIDGKPGKVYYPLEKITIPEPQPKDNEVHLLQNPLLNPRIQQLTNLFRPSYPSPPPPSTTATSSSANTSTLAQPSAFPSLPMASAS
jgi:hypothetical protein